MKCKILFTILVMLPLLSKAQSFSNNKITLKNFITRMYISSPFEGVKIIDDYDHQYLISVISLDKSKYTSESIMIRVAQVKAQSQANTFLNGATISMEMIITTIETKDSSNHVKTVVETIEQIKQNSLGFSTGLELLTNFETSNNLNSVFIYLRELQ